VNERLSRYCAIAIPDEVARMDEGKGAIIFSTIKRLNARAVFPKLDKKPRLIDQRC
jgi:hypothetical protein